MCPELVFVKPNFKKYKEASDIFRQIVTEYDPFFISLGLDEVNCDVTDYLQRMGLDNDEGR